MLRKTVATLLLNRRHHRRQERLTKLMIRTRLHLPVRKLNQIPRSSLNVLHSSQAGCANPPKGPKLSECCPNFPTFFSKNAMAKTCNNKCQSSTFGQRVCCFTDCAMSDFGVLTDGKFDADKAKKMVAGLVNGNKEWTPEVGKGFRIL